MYHGLFIFSKYILTNCVHFLCMILYVAYFAQTVWISPPVFDEHGYNDKNLTVFVHSGYLKCTLGRISDV